MLALTRLKGGGGVGRIWALMQASRREAGEQQQQKCGHQLQQARDFTYFDDYGKVLREEARAFEAVFMLRRENELQEKLRNGITKLDEIKEAHLKLRDYVQAQLLFHGELKGGNAASQIATIRLPEWLELQQI